MNFYHIEIDTATLVETYAGLFAPDNGDTVLEFVSIAGVTVYPASQGDDLSRRRFERALRIEINKRERNRRMRRAA